MIPTRCNSFFKSIGIRITFTIVSLNREPQTLNPEAEQIARFADDFGFDGSLFRNSSQFDDYQLWTKWASKTIQKQIDAVFRVIAEMEKPADRTIIPDGVELLTIPQVARLLGWSEGAVRERDNKGLLPIPSRFGGTIQWRKKELENWMRAGCPARQKWELQKPREEL